MKGLTSEQVTQKREEQGPNSIQETNKVTWYNIVARQFKSILLWILVIAAIISLFVDEMIEFYFIAAIVGIIVITGFLQEFKAEKAMQQLKEMVSPTIRAYRDGQSTELASEQLVTEDIIQLEMGDKIPADAKILSSTDLRVDEAILTGESSPVSKQDGDTVFSGTSIVHGRAEAQVSAIGMNTELGKIAGDIQQTDENTPLQNKIQGLGEKLGFIAVGAAALIFVLGMIAEAPFVQILLVTIALAVASVPEGLPLTLTLTLSLGMQDMAKKNAIVRKMLAVEGLGSTTVICTDKTGTLTKNEMTVTHIYADNQEYDVTGSGYDPRGEIRQDNTAIKAKKQPTLHQLIQAGALCNNSQLRKEDHAYKILGEPTEGALSVLAHKATYNPQTLKEQQPTTKEIIFTSERKMMSTVHKNNKQYVVYSKGAPEILLDKCSHILINGKKKKLTKKQREQITKQNNTYAQQALRVLAIAQKTSSKKPAKQTSIEKDLTLLGLVGMIDPAREEAKQAIADCRTAGIQVKMITGDNPITAKAIAQAIELTDNGEVLTGPQLDELDDKQLAQAIQTTHIFARTKPQHKLRIVEALQKNNEIVAMTGDGVNDAPAIKKADVGVGMGIKGTDVTKESADIILQDDNFSTIVEAIKDGRKIYDNIEKFTTYLVSRSFTEVIIIAIGAMVLGFDYLPLLALQILFLNVIGEEMPAVALGLDPATPGIMERSPRDPNQQILDKRNLFLVVGMASFMAITGFAIFMLSEPLTQLATARTILFASIVLMIIVHSFNFRSLTRSIREVGMFGNKWILAAVALTGIILYTTIHTPAVAEIFEHVPLTINQWLLAASGAAVTMAFIEILKKAANKLYGEGY